MVAVGFTESMVGFGLYMNLSIFCGFTFGFFHVTVTGKYLFSMESSVALCVKQYTSSLVLKKRPMPFIW